MRFADRIHGALYSLKLRLAVTGALLIAVSVACTVFFVFRSLEPYFPQVAEGICA